MELYYDEARLEYLKRMERIVAEHVSTKGHNNDEYYRYPVTLFKNGKEKQFWGWAEVAYNDFKGLYYKFGAHRLYIGKALLDVMACYEKGVDNYRR